MPEIRLEHVNKRWGRFYAVEDLNLTIGDNSFVTLLGPSGCGKTTTLRMIAGLETPTSGRITIGDRVVFDSEKGINVPANKRKVGFLFQNYALWPNMTVYENISFGLKNIVAEMPVIDFEAKNDAAMMKILANPEEVRRIVGECRDANGAVDRKRAVLKIIDAFCVSAFTAEKLYALDFLKNSDFSAKIAALDADLKSRVAKGSLNADFEFTENGRVVRKKRKLTREEIDLSVRRVARIVKIGIFMDRYPAELSGGQQQRVAIARTLAPEPTVLFMDEPLSNLDAKLRLEMRYELQRLHIETGSTFVYVTHDQMEAMTLATHICLIDNGVLQQYREPLEIYRYPANLFVADFIGNPSINFIDAKGSQDADGSVSLGILDGHKVRFAPEKPVDLKKWFADRDARIAEAGRKRAEAMGKKGFVSKSNADEVFRHHIAKVNEEEDYDVAPREKSDGDFVMAVRPEFVEMSDSGAIPGEIYAAMPTGMETTVKIRVGQYLLTGVVFERAGFRVGSEVRLNFRSDGIMLFDARSGELISVGRVSESE